MQIVGGAFDVKEKGMLVWLEERDTNKRTIPTFFGLSDLGEIQVTPEVVFRFLEAAGVRIPKDAKLGRVAVYLDGYPHKCVNEYLEVGKGCGRCSSCAMVEGADYMLRVFDSYDEPGDKGAVFVWLKRQTGETH